MNAIPINEIREIHCTYLNPVPGQITVVYTRDEPSASFVNTTATWANHLGTDGARELNLDPDEVTPTSYPFRNVKMWTGRKVGGVYEVDSPAMPGHEIEKVICVPFPTEEG